MLQTDPHYYGQGRLLIAQRLTGGTLGPWTWLGDVSAFSLKLTTEKVEHKESWSGQRALTDSFPVGKTCTLDLTLHQLSPDNLALALYGTVSTIAQGTVTGEAFPPAVAANDDVYLNHLAVTDVVITDATAGAPKTLVPDVDYSLDADFGRVTLLNVAGYTQPFTRAYAYAATQAVGLFTRAQPVIALRYEGINLADGNAPVLVTLYKVATDPLQELALITTGTDVAGMQVSAGLLADLSKPANGPLGQFGSIVTVRAA